MLLRERVAAGTGLLVMTCRRSRRLRGETSLRLVLGRLLNAPKSKEARSLRESFRGTAALRAGD